MKRPQFKASYLYQNYSVTECGIVRRNNDRKIITHRHYGGYVKVTIDKNT